MKDKSLQELVKHNIMTLYTIQTHAQMLLEMSGENLHAATILPELIAIAEEIQSRFEPRGN